VPVRPSALHVVVYGGLAAGLLDIINATTFWFLYSGAPPARILQAIAAGLLGKESFAGGASTATLGLILHFLIAFGMAAVYWLACRRWPILLQRPVVAGRAYGIAAYLAMTHVVLVGLLLAFVARWSAHRR